MRLLCSLVLVFIFHAPPFFAQGVKIGTNPGAPHGSSILELQSTSQGLLPPRMTSEERDAISDPAQGLIIYNITTNCENYYSGSAWFALCGSCIPGIPGQPSVISGTTTPCSGDSGLTYSVADEPGTTYTWTLPSGWVQTSGGSTHSITADVSSSSGTVSVSPSNGCGTGTARTLTVTTGNTPSVPTAGSHDPSDDDITWVWSAVSGASGYKWSTANNYIGATDIGNFTSYNQSGLTCGGNTYTLYVWAYNSCGVSSSVALTASTTSCPPNTKIIFVEEIASLQSTMYGGLAGADAICQNAANNASLPGTFRAMLSTASIAAKDRLNEGIFIRPDGQIIANSKADLFDGTIAVTPNQNEFGATLVDSNLHAYTGSTSSGTYMGSNTTCGEWTDFNQQGRYGKPTHTDQDWISRNTWTCSTNTSSSGLYCVQQ